MNTVLWKLKRLHVRRSSNSLPRPAVERDFERSLDILSRANAFKQGVSDHLNITLRSLLALRWGLFVLAAVMLSVSNAQSQEDGQQVNAQAAGQGETSIADSALAAAELAIERVETNESSDEETSGAKEVSSSQVETAPSETAQTTGARPDAEGAQVGESTKAPVSKTEPPLPETMLAQEPTGLRAPDQTRRMIAAAAQVQDLIAPVALGKAGRVIVTYGEALPVLVCTDLAVCTVELEKGENLVDTPVIGDPVRWSMEQRQVVWPGQEKQWIFVFKPSADADRMSTAVFVTDRRIYSIVLKRHPFEYVPILSFDYPDTRHRLIAEKIEADRLALLQAQADEAKAKADAAAAANARANRAVKASGTKTERGLIPAERLDFDYRISGRAAFKPTQVYNDGRKTYVVLPSSYRGPLPVLLAGQGSSNAAINIKFNNGRFVIDRIVDSFTLGSGSKTIKITRLRS